MTAAELTRRFSVDGAELAWDAWGDAPGPTLALCHGFSGSAHDFAMHVDSLAARQRVIALDHRGHGRSSKANAVGSYSLDRLTADLIELLVAHGDGPVDLLGHSMGGQVAIRAALSRPDLVNSLVLMDTSAWSFVPDDEAQAGAIRAFIEAFDPSGGLPDLRSLGGPEDDLIAQRTPLSWQARRDELAAAFDPFAMKALGAELFDPKRISVRHRLHELACPVTVIVGSLDHPLVDQAHALIGEIPHARLEIIEGAYHSPQLTQPTEWRQALGARA